MTEKLPLIFAMYFIFPSHWPYEYFKTGLISPQGGYKVTVHASHPAIIKRLKRAEGHLKSIIDMLENERACLEITQQLQAVENAIANAKKTLVRDHIDHCLEEALHDKTRNAEDTIEEFKAITKYL